MKIVKMIGALCMFAFLSVAAIASQNFGSELRTCGPNENTDLTCPGTGFDCCFSINSQRVISTNQPV